MSSSLNTRQRETLWQLLEQGLPLVPRPWAELAHQAGCSEEQVLERLRSLAATGALSRVGPVMEHSKAGASPLVALAVPPAQIEQIATYINRLPEVNHNYEREHRYNLWFVLTGPSRSHLDAVLQNIQHDTGLEPLDLPMLKSYRIDLGFPLFANTEVPS